MLCCKNDRKSAWEKKALDVLVWRRLKRTFFFFFFPSKIVDRKKPVDEVLKKNRNYSNFFIYGGVGRENFKKKFEEKKKS